MQAKKQCVAHIIINAMSFMREYATPGYMAMGVPYNTTDITKFEASEQQPFSNASDSLLSELVTIIKQKGTRFSTLWSSKYTVTTIHDKTR
jgi:hypothetical protein